MSKNDRREASGTSNAALAVERTIHQSIENTASGVYEISQALERQDSNIVRLDVGRKAQEKVRPRLMTETDAARYLGVSKSFLNASRCYGNRSGRTPAPPYVRIGERAVRYDIRDLDAWIEKHRVHITTL